MGYLLIEEDLYYGYPITEWPDKFSDISLKSGHYLTLNIKEPLVFETKCPPDEFPGHNFLHDCIPVCSQLMVNIFKAAGIDNFQIFPAILINKEKGVTWKDYYAFNAVGLIDAANRDKSEVFEIMLGDEDGGMPALVNYEKLIIDPKRVGGMYMFRELRSLDLVFDDRVEEQFKKLCIQP